MASFPTYGELIRDVNRRLERSGITDVVNTGSVSNLMVNAFISEISRLAEYAKRAFANAFSVNASGVYLDLHGEAVGLTRRNRLPAIILTEDENLQISSSTGTLRERIGASIPANTKVTTSDGTTSFTIPLTLIPEGVTKMYLTAVADATGSGSNVNTGELNSLSLNVSGITVTNLKPVNSGTEIESDSSFRSRIIGVTSGFSGINESTIIAALAGIPDVVHVFVVDSAFGINHPAIILSGNSRLRSSVVSAAQAIADSLLPFGSRVVILAPKYKTLDLSISVRTTPGASKPAVKSLVTSVVKNFFFPHVPGKALNIYELDGAVTRADSRIVDLDVLEVRLDDREFSGRVIRTLNTEQIVLGTLTIEVV